MEDREARRIAKSVAENFYDFYVQVVSANIADLPALTGIIYAGLREGHDPVVIASNAQGILKLSASEYYALLGILVTT